MTSYALSLTVVVVDPRRLDLVFLAGKPAGSTETLSRTLKIMSLAVATEEIVFGASFNLKRPIFSNLLTATSLDMAYCKCRGPSILSFDIWT